MSSARYEVGELVNVVPGADGRQGLYTGVRILREHGSPAARSAAEDLLAEAEARLDAERRKAVARG